MSRWLGWNRPEMTQHVMIDIETMGSGVNSVILSVGAVRFNPFASTVPYPPTLENYEKLDNYFYERATMNSGLAAGFEVEAQTIEKFWLANPEMFKEAIRQPRNEIRRLLGKLTKWYNLNSDNEPVWANGSTFDLAILNHAYSKVHHSGGRPPWRYKDELDQRTMFRIAPVEKRDNPYPHNPLWDSWTQALSLQDSFRKLGLEEDDFSYK